MRGPLSLYLAVAAGSVCGGVLRASTSAVVQQIGDAGFPVGTLFVNVVGSFIIGFYATLTGPDGRSFVSVRQRQFVMTGICGGFTTFSVFSLETFRLVQADRLLAAGANVGISVLAWLAAVWLGHAIASRINRIGGN
ncbi:chromosome condensation protein CrcB [Chelatococcus daeguensis]|uniref:Fluoride-specific ion channel FluC n=1 Tax=Chelatococcus daeguensis TaxID=444444 RepID=A0AAC9JV82_9HYPH|nr:chromosome condensation protein CrcB [Chelatococcus daeguensis]